MLSNVLDKPVLVGYNYLFDLKFDLQTIREQFCFYLFFFHFLYFPSIKTFPYLLGGSVGEGMGLCRFGPYFWGLSLKGRPWALTSTSLSLKTTKITTHFHSCFCRTARCPHIKRGLECYLNFLSLKLSLVSLNSFDIYLKILKQFFIFCSAVWVSLKEKVHPVTWPTILKAGIPAVFDTVDHNILLETLFSLSGPHTTPSCDSFSLPSLICCFFLEQPNTNTRTAQGSESGVSSTLDSLLWISIAPTVLNIINMLKICSFISPA